VSSVSANWPFCTSSRACAAVSNSDTLRSVPATEKLPLAYRMSSSVACSSIAATFLAFVSITSVVFISA
jgi:hypothetical protein